MCCGNDIKTKLLACLATRITTNDEKTIVFAAAAALDCVLAVDVVAVAVVDWIWMQPVK